MSKMFSLALTVAMLLPLSAAAQDGPELPQPSPKAMVMQRVGLTDITVTYSSPAKRKRKVFGKLVPYGKLWRTGANMATKIEFSGDVTFGGTKVPAGAYAVFSIPTRKGWTIILNKNTDQGGTGSYDEKLDAARIKRKAKWVPPRERMTFMFSDTTNNTTKLQLEWDRLRVSIPIEVDTASQVEKNIERATSRTWLPDIRAANYILDNGGDVKTALAHADKSVAIKSTWYNNWNRARILEKMGNKADAKAAVETALSLGDDGPGFKFYQTQMQDALKRLK